MQFGDDVEGGDVKESYAGSYAKGVAVGAILGIVFEGELNKLLFVFVVFAALSAYSYWTVNRKTE